MAFLDATLCIDCTNIYIGTFGAPFENVFINTYEQCAIYVWVRYRCIHLLLQHTCGAASKFKCVSLDVAQRLCEIKQ